MDFSTRTVLVTGGASGIGLATAEVLAELRARVVLADRDGEAAGREAARIGANAEALELDVGDFDRVAAAVAELDARLPLGGVVNAAGVLQTGTVADLDEASWDRVLGVNLKGTFAVCKAAIAAFAARGKGGAIVNLSSIGGRTKSQHGGPNYVASKAGVIGLTMSLAAQNAGAGIRVNCVAPGVISTPMTASLSAEQHAQSVAAIPLGRLGEAREVGQVIASLLSEEWGYVTGQTINVNGGMFMQ